MVRNVKWLIIIKAARNYLTAFFNKFRMKLPFRIAFIQFDFRLFYFIIFNSILLLRPLSCSVLLSIIILVLPKPTVVNLLAATPLATKKFLTVSALCSDNF